MKNRLHVVIGGYGRVGRYLAHMLEYEGHTVSVIDHDPLAFDEDESDSVIGTRHIGPVFDREVLEAAGIREADCFAAVTSGDNSNIVAARTAKEHYRVPRVIARIYDPRRAEIYRGLGIATIASVTWTGTRLLDMVTHPDLHSEYEFGNGEMKMLAVELPAGMEGRGSADVDIPGEVLLTSVVREGQAILPFDGLTFEKNDVLYISTLAESTTKVERILGLSE
ncbi:MAG TPA: TrkA family potassium uptake protein [Coriobacteriia bacterium]|nr:TrkA family potassium uptake protein [Coriobacteriia bacterium]